MDRRVGRRGIGRKLAMVGWLKLVRAQEKWSDTPHPKIRRSQLGEGGRWVKTGPEATLQISKRNIAEKNKVRCEELQGGGRCVIWWVL